MESMPAATPPKANGSSVNRTVLEPPRHDLAADTSAMRILKLPPHTVRHHPDNPEITLAEVTGLLDSMRQDGQLQPGMVYPDPEWVCGIGNHRLFCCRVLGIDFLAYALGHPVSRKEMRRLRLTENTFRQTMTPIKVGEEIFTHIRETGDSDDAASEFFRLSNGYVSKLLAPFRRGIPQLQQALKDGSIVAGGAPYIAALPPELQLKAIASCMGKKRDIIISICANLRGRAKGEKPLKLKAAGIDMTIRKPTPEGIQAFLDSVAVALRKLSKEGLPMSVLPSLVRS